MCPGQRRRQADRAIPSRLHPLQGHVRQGSKVCKEGAFGSCHNANIPLQLVKANPAMGMGAMQGVTYIQRVATVGGIAPKAACAQANEGAKQ
ncbi:MAG TPA: DUF3455 domain-containing protein, partial [Giesbergeria sp.]|nr:DUF3455 domain-containing protein [Giesbergeria sp.]